MYSPCLCKSLKHCIAIIKSPQNDAITCDFSLDSVSLSEILVWKVLLYLILYYQYLLKMSHFMSFLPSCSIAPSTPNPSKGERLLCQMMRMKICLHRLSIISIIRININSSQSRTNRYLWTRKWARSMYPRLILFVNFIWRINVKR